MDVDVAIVGAGFAGLSAAMALRDEGVSCYVLEARDRVGGRVLNDTLPDGTPIEVGGQWVGPTQDRLMALAEALGVQTYPTYNEGENVFVRRGRRSTYRGTIPRLSPHVLLSIAMGIRRQDGIARRVPLDRPWEAPDALELDSMTVETWIRSNVRTETARDMMRLATASLFSAEPKDISMLHYLFYLHSGGFTERMIDVAGGAQESRFVGGSQLIAIRMGEALGDSVRAGSEVLAIEHSSGSVRCETRSGSVTARHCIVCLPPALAQRIRFDPPLPSQRDQLMQKMPMGSVIKVMAVYPEPFWRAAGLTGQATGDTPPVRITYDNTPPQGAPGVLLGFIEGADARWWGPRPGDERAGAVVSCFETFFGPKASSPIAYLEKDWSADPYSRGCYGAHLGPGVLTGFGAALREPCGVLHWAGTETSEVWCGYMEGAIRSGERAASEVLSAL